MRYTALSPTSQVFYASHHLDFNRLQTGLQKLLHPAIPDGRTWSKFGEHGVSLENMGSMENMEKMEDINQMTQKSPEDV